MQVRPEPAEEAGDPWSRRECDVAVAAYFDMWTAEMLGRAYVKTHAVDALAGLLPVRKKGAIERKLQNVSAVLDEIGIGWIEGYKPLPHYQQELRYAVLDYLGSHQRIGERYSDYVETPVPPASTGAPSLEDVLVQPPSVDRAPRSPVSVTSGPVGALRDFKNRRLGAAGEEWVVELEKAKLVRAGKLALARDVKWVARDEGDGAGYDVRSFRSDESELLIEVKTTNLGSRTPFYVTAWEVETSARRADSYSLYRVFGFAREPRLYRLDGSIRDNARLEPKVFLGLPG